MSVGMIILIVVIVLIILIAIFVANTYNSLVSLKNKVADQWAQVDVVLKRRADLIPNLVETVKGYAKHESSTLEAVVKMRNVNYGSMSQAEKIENGTQLSKVLPQIFALSESYPDLKANQNFMELSSQLQKLEDDISNARRYYNGAVKKYNMSVQTFPRNIIAGMFHFETRPMFEVEDTAQRENVQVKF